MKKLIWRLANQPTVDELQKAMAIKLITPLEARSILVREEEEKKIDRDELKDLKDELKLLREMVLKLSEQEPAAIKIIENYYHRYNWNRFPDPFWRTSYITCASNMTNNSGTHLLN